MILRATLLFAAAAVIGVGAQQVFAAEAYLCGPDNVVYVEIENLEAMKRTDPCIAGYYGLKVEPKPAAPAATAAKTLQPAAAKAAAVVATMAAKSKPALATTPTSALVASDVARDLRPLIAADEPSTAHFETDETTPADIAPVVAAAGTDFRKVRVINAHSPEDMWFHHLR